MKAFIIWINNYLYKFNAYTNFFFVRNIFATNVVLLLILLYFAISTLFVNDINSFINKLDHFLNSSDNSDAYIKRILPFVQTAQYLLASLGIIIAAVWGYYLFIKGRTFNSKLSCEIELSDQCGPQKDVAILRCTIENVGKARVRLINVEVEVKLGLIDSKEINYELIHEKNNLLDTYGTQKENKFWLEPGDAMKIDFAERIPQYLFNKESGEYPHCILKVDLVIEDSNYLKWNEKRLLALNK